MAGTGIHGYTGPALYGGSYNISNGIIQSGSGATSSGVVNRNSPYGSGSVSTSAANNGMSVSDIVTKMANAITSAGNASNSSYKDALVGYAQKIGDIVSQSNSDYADIVREILANQDANTAKSQAFAREQMDYQTRSDKAAMSWSAQEAQKNRDWQERLSNTAHQREVQDLVAAGLNPILSANAGAYTGSGATGQGFSSSGAMGQVDMSGTAAIGSLVSSLMNTAMQAHVAELYTNAERYNSDLQYSASRLATEASILNNQNTNSSTRKNVLSQIEADLERTRIQGEYGLQNTALSNEGAMQRTVLQEAGETGRQVIHEAGETTRTGMHEEGETGRTEYKTDYGSFWSGGPWHKIAEDASDIITAGGNKIKQFLNRKGKATVNLLEGLEDLVGKSKTQGRMIDQISWG